jgi:ABC-type uncharacterized transport system substrate-binding protein
MRRQLFIKSAYYVKKILEGANPGDLPVEPPTRIELWINPKTAKALGLDIPMNFQQLADRVIEYRCNLLRPLSPDVAHFGLGVMSDVSP